MNVHPYSLLIFCIVVCTITDDSKRMKQKFNFNQPTDLAMAYQIDQLSKQLFNLKPEAKRIEKRQHTKQMRRQRKNIEMPNPQHNRYEGFIA